MTITQPHEVAPLQVKAISLRAAEGNITNRWLPQYNADDASKTVTLPADSTWTDLKGNTINGNTYNIDPWSCGILFAKPITVTESFVQSLPITDSDCGNLGKSVPAVTSKSPTYGTGGSTVTPDGLWVLVARGPFGLSVYKSSDLSTVYKDITIPSFVYNSASAKVQGGAKLYGKHLKQNY